MAWSSGNRMKHIIKCSLPVLNVFLSQPPLWQRHCKDRLYCNTATYNAKKRKKICTANQKQCRNWHPCIQKCIVTGYPENILENVRSVTEISHHFPRMRKTVLFFCYACGAGGNRYDFLERIGAVRQTPPQRGKRPSAFKNVCGCSIFLLSATDNPRKYRKPILEKTRNYGRRDGGVWTWICSGCILLPVRFP